MRKGPNQPPPKTIKRPQPPPCPPKKDTSFEKFRDDIAKKLSEELDIPIDIIKMEFGKGFSYSKIYIECERKRIDMLKKFFKPVYDKILFEFLEEYNDKNKNT